jgi:YggT family protein
VPALAYTLDLILRGLALAAAAAAGLVALTHWAVQERKLAPFGAWATFVRRLSDPLLRPLERWLFRVGRSPQEAPFWLFGLAVVAGIAALSLTRALIGFAFTLDALRSAPPTVWARIAVGLVFELLMLALIVRVLGSWFGWTRWTRWTRPAWILTDWLVEPIRRRLPPFGMIDLSPLVAWVVLLVLRALVLSLF